MRESCQALEKTVCRHSAFIHSGIGFAGESSRRSGSTRLRKCKHPANSRHDNYQSIQPAGNHQLAELQYWLWRTHLFQSAQLSSIALNRISPAQGASQIYGRLEANGRIILVNPAGIFFGAGSFVNVGGLIATTTNITDDNFKAGHFVFNQASPYANASIINQGTLVAARNGLIALVGQNVTNDGKIVANLGKVVLASGDTFTVNFSGNDMVNFALTPSGPSRGGSVRNTGSIIANGGSILVTAKQAAGVLDNVINLEGVVEAKAIYKQGGDIIISVTRMLVW